MKHLILTILITLMLAQATQACLLQNGKSVDLNNDGIIDITDASNLILHWGASSLSVDWNNHKFADLNNDGIIDITDASNLILHWGEVCSLDPKILSESNFIDNLGYYTIVGEVQNNLNENINFVKVTATFYDKQNTVIGMGYTYTDMDILRPGQKSPFELSSYPDKINPASYKLTVSYSKTNSDSYNGLQILSHTSKIDQLGYHEIVGEVKNGGVRIVSFVKVVATYYDSSGKVIGKSFAFTSPDEIPVSNIAPFEISSYPLKITPAKYELQVEGQ